MHGDSGRGERSGTSRSGTRASIILRWARGARPLGVRKCRGRPSKGGDAVLISCSSGATTTQSRSKSSANVANLPRRFQKRDFANDRYSQRAAERTQSFDRLYRSWERRARRTDISPARPRSPCLARRERVEHVCANHILGAPRDGRSLVKQARGVALREAQDRAGPRDDAARAQPAIRRRQVEGGAATVEALVEVCVRWEEGAE